MTQASFVWRWKSVLFNALWRHKLQWRHICKRLIRVRKGCTFHWCIDCGKYCCLICRGNLGWPSYSNTNGNKRHRPLLESFSSQFLKSGDILWTSGRQFLIKTSTPVTISVILNRSQLDAGSLIQAERNEKAIKRIQKKIMCARSRNTLDWSQSNNISCHSDYLV